MSVWVIKVIHLAALPPKLLFFCIFGQTSHVGAPGQVICLALSHILNSVVRFFVGIVSSEMVIYCRWTLLFEVRPETTNLVRWPRRCAEWLMIEMRIGHVGVAG